MLIVPKYCATVTFVPKTVIQPLDRNLSMALDNGCCRLSNHPGNRSYRQLQHQAIHKTGIQTIKMFRLEVYTTIHTSLSNGAIQPPSAHRCRASIFVSRSSFLKLPSITPYICPSTATVMLLSVQTNSYTWNAAPQCCDVLLDYNYYYEKTINRFTMA